MLMAKIEISTINEKEGFMSYAKIIQKTSPQQKLLLQLAH